MCDRVARAEADLAALREAAQAVVDHLSLGGHMSRSSPEIIALDRAVLASAEPMTIETARQVMADVACPCDGRGVRPGPDGVTVPCERCSGTFRSAADVKRARAVLASADSEDREETP